MADYKDSGAELYHAGRIARVRDGERDTSQPRPWLLGWDDEDYFLKALATPEYHRLQVASLGSTEEGHS